MMKSKTLGFALAAAMLVPVYAHAETSYVDTLVDKLGQMRSGKTPKSASVEAVGAVDSWGDAAAPRNKPPQLRTAQQVDERDMDDRFARAPASASKKPAVVSEPPAAARPSKVASASHDEDVAPVRKSKARRAAEPTSDAFEDRYSAREERTAKASAAAACVNVSRAWEGAAALAARGEEDRAYAGYLRLLSSCSSDKELMGTVFQLQKNLGPEWAERLKDEPVMASPKLEAAYQSLGLQQMFAANKARDYKTALRVSRELREFVLASDNTGALEVSGWLEQKSKNPKVAEKLFRAALRVDRDLSGAREGLVFALLAQGRVDMAEMESRKLDSVNAESILGEVSLAQARQASEAGDFDVALKKLDQAERQGVETDASVMATRAWALRGAKKPEQAAKLFSKLMMQDPYNEDYQSGLVESLASAKDFESLEKLTNAEGATGVRARELVAARLETQGRRAEAARVSGKRAEGLGSSVALEAGTRTKSGDAGEGQMSMTIEPGVKAVAALSDTTRVEVDGASIRMDDKVHAVTGKEARVRLTTRVADAEVMVGVGASQVQGSTEATYEGKVRVYQKDGYIEGGIERAPMTDSVRAYAGVTDEDGKRVGRAMRTGLTAAGQTEMPNDMKLSWTAGAGYVTGKNIDSNNYLSARATLLKDYPMNGFSWFALGPELRMESWGRDHNQFEGGNGGYFSPKSDFGAGIRVHAQTEEGKRSLYRATGYAGYSARTLSYGSETGVATEFDGGGAWLLSRYAILRAGLSFKNSPGYTDVGVKFGLVIPFEARTGLYSSDLSSGSTP